VVHCFKRPARHIIGNFEDKILGNRLSMYVSSLVIIIIITIISREHWIQRMTFAAEATRLQGRQTHGS